MHRQCIGRRRAVALPCLVHCDVAAAQRARSLGHECGRRRCPPARRRFVACVSNRCRVPGAPPFVLRRSGGTAAGSARAPVVGAKQLTEGLSRGRDAAVAIGSAAVPKRAGPVLKRLLDVPAALYRARAGCLLGHRFLLLTHRGRRSGRLYQTVLEVVCWRPETAEAVVASGWGPRAQWYRNVCAGGAVQIQIARQRFRPRARVLPVEEATAVLADYERRNRMLLPVIRVVLSRLAGFRYDGSDAGRRRLVQALPLVAFHPDD